jgi:hypothetical protein
VRTNSTKDPGENDSAGQFDDVFMTAQEGGKRTTTRSKGTTGGKTP